MNDFTPITSREELDAVIAPYKEKTETLEKRVEKLTKQLTAASEAISENTQAIANLTMRFDIHNRHS